MRGLDIIGATKTPEINVYAAGIGLIGLIVGACLWRKHRFLGSLVGTTVGGLVGKIVVRDGN